MSDEDKAVDSIADFVKMVIKGWPIYGVVFAMMVGYGELYLDAKIAKAIKTQTLEQPAIVGLTGAVQTNTDSIQGVRSEVGRVSEQVEIVEEDTKAILKIMAGD